MAYCTEYGTELVERYLENEGMIPYCESCGVYRFPTFNVAIIAIVYSPDAEKFLLEWLEKREKYDKTFDSYKFLE